MVPETAPNSSSLHSANQVIIDRVSSTVDSWTLQPVEDKVYHALLLVGLNVAEIVPWKAQSEILATRLLALVMDDLYRAHSMGVYSYFHG